MFDELFAWLLLAVLFACVGWVLGIIAFFRGGRALREVAALRQVMARAAGGASEGAAAPGAAVIRAPPPVVVAPVPVLATPVLATPGPRAEISAIPGLPGLAGPTVPRRSVDLEELLTARWGVWLGAAALLFAGVFLVRYAAEEGWLGPAVRCVALALLGVALVVGGLFLARRPVKGLPFPDQAPAGLAAGGVVMLFGAAYAASVVYALVPSFIGFVLMAAASLVGLVLSLALGPLVAVVGIAGAFVTPALVQTEAPSLPGLFGYLLFVAAAALAVVRYSAWSWLGWATTIAGAGWVMFVAVSAPGYESWAPALFVPALAALHLVLLPQAALEGPIGRKLAWIPVAVVGAAGLLLALVDPGMVTRTGLLLLVPVTLAKAASERRLVRLPWVAAVLFLLLIGLWGLPAWQPTGEAIVVDGRLLAVLPGDWTPEVLRPFLLTAFGVAALFALAGLAAERRVVGPALAWLSYPAAVPVLALAIAYARVRQFQPDAAWGVAALLLALALTGTAALAMRAGADADGARRRAGVHAAGATAALALGFAMLLSGQWLTIALVLLVPGLVSIERRADLAPLRRIALAVAGVALVRLLLNNAVLDYVAGAPPFLNGRALAYLVAAIAFAVSARMARPRADDLLVAVLELGSAAFATALVALEIRQWATDGLPRSAVLTFTEAALQEAALAALATIVLVLEARSGRVALRWAWGVQGALALVGGIGLIIVNPMLLDGLSEGRTPILDALLPAYAVPALLAAFVLRYDRFSVNMRRFLSLYALVAAFAWVTLEVRHIAHPDAMGLRDSPVLDGELWAWSGAWMALAIGLMAGGLVWARRELRMAALAVIALVSAKVFLVDMAGLTGLWRVLSFLGLGLTLIGLGRLYGRLIGRPGGAAATGV